MSLGPRKRLVALAAASALLLSGCDFSIYDISLPGGADVGDDPYRVTVEFRDVMDLVPQSTVKVDDVTVGTVEEVELDGYAAKVSLLLRKDVKLPDNAEAEIRQTSLLGEKFVSLKPPASNPSPELLGDGDTIGLERSGRNVEVEEVLGALSLVLNGGGVAQLKTITQELNTAFEGREGTVRSVLTQLRLAMEQFDTSRNEIVRAIEQVNSLAVSLNARTDDLDLALQELPSAIASVDRQRDDLIKMLKALQRLSGVGTRVIEASKAGTIDSINALAPTLTELARTGDDLVNSLQIVLTFPFMDGIVGKNPQQARDLHMGDFTNLSVQLDLDLKTAIPAIGNPGGGPGTPEIPLPDLPDLPVPVPTLTVFPPPTGGDDGGLLPGLGRAPVGEQVAGTSSRSVEGRDEARGDGIDTELAAMLTWGVMER